MSSLATLPQHAPAMSHGLEPRMTPLRSLCADEHSWVRSYCRPLDDLRAYSHDCAWVQEYEGYEVTWSYSMSTLCSEYTVCWPYTDRDRDQHIVCLPIALFDVDAGWSWWWWRRHDRDRDGDDSDGDDFAGSRSPRSHLPSPGSSAGWSDWSSDTDSDASIDSPRSVLQSGHRHVHLDTANDKVEQHVTITIDADLRAASFAAVLIDPHSIDMHGIASLRTIDGELTARTASAGLLCASRDGDQRQSAAPQYEPVLSTLSSECLPETSIDLKRGQLIDIDISNLARSALTAAGVILVYAIISLTATPSTHARHGLP